MSSNVLRKCLFVIILCRVSFGTLEIPEQDVSTISKALLFVIENSFAKITSSIVIYQSSTHLKQSYLHSDILEYILLNIDYLAVDLDVSDDHYTYDPWYYNVLFVDSVEAFQNINSKMIRSSYDDATYYLIVLTLSEGNYYNVMEDIFEICWRSNIINVNILIEPFANTILMYSYFPYKKNHCAEAFPVIINRFVNDSMVRTVMFPRKAKNMQGCPLLILAAWNNAPYIMVDYNKKGSARFSGIEGQVLIAMADILNFTVNLISPPKTDTRSKVYENGTLSGAFKTLTDNGGEMLIGNFWYTKTRTQYFTATFAYYQVPMVFIVNDEVFYSPLRRLISPFHTTVWICIAVFLTASIILAIILDFTKPKIRPYFFGETNTAPILNMISVTLGGPVEATITRNFPRLLLMTWLLETLLLRSTYQGLLYHFLRTDMTQKPPDTIEEITDQEYSISTSIGALELLENFSLIGKASASSASMDEKLEILQQSSSEEKTSVFGPQDFILYYNFRNFNRSTLHIVKERLFVQHNCIYLRKHSHLKFSFDELLMRFISSGLIQEWASWYADDKYNTPDKTITGPKIFDNSKLAGAYQLYVVLIAVSTAIFALELISHRMPPLRGVLAYFH